MKNLMLILASVGLLAMSVPAQAGGGHYYGGHRYGGNHYGGHGRHHGYRYGGHYGGRYGHGRHGYHDGYKYIGAGLLLGAIVHEAFRPQVVTTNRVVYRSPPRSGEVYAPTPAQPATQSSGQPAPEIRHDVYLRKDPNGECWLIERQEDGTEIITPQEAGVCG